MKIKNEYFALILVFGSFLFVWHYRADLIDLAKIAKQESARLSAECTA